jgi:hypothetical protein
VNSKKDRPYTYGLFLITILKVSKKKTTLTIENFLDKKETGFYAIGNFSKLCRVAVDVIFQQANKYFSVGEVTQDLYSGDISPGGYFVDLNSKNFKNFLNFTIGISVISHHFLVFKNFQKINCFFSSKIFFGKKSLSHLKTWLLKIMLFRTRNNKIPMNSFFSAEN